MLGRYIHLVHLYLILLLKTPERKVVRTGIEPVRTSFFYLINPLIVRYNSLTLQQCPNTQWSICVSIRHLTILPSFRAVTDLPILCIKIRELMLCSQDRIRTCMIPAGIFHLRSLPHQVSVIIVYHSAT